MLEAWSETEGGEEGEVAGGRERMVQSNSEMHIMVNMLVLSSRRYEIMQCPRPLFSSTFAHHVLLPSQASLSIELSPKDVPSRKHRDDETEKHRQPRGFRKPHHRLRTRRARPSLYTSQNRRDQHHVPPAFTVPNSPEMGVYGAGRYMANSVPLYGLKYPPFTVAAGPRSSQILRT